MSIVDPDIAGRSAPPEDAGGAPPGAAYCPHCAAPVGGGVFPWPPDPTRCPSCGQWIGRNRAAGDPVDAPAAEEPEEAHDVHEEKPRSRAMSFLRGRRSNDDAHEAPPDGDGDGDGEVAAAEMWAPDTFEFDAPAATAAKAVEEEPSDAVEEEDPPAAIQDDEQPPAGEPASPAEAQPTRRRRGGLAGRVRELRSRAKSDLLPGATGDKATTSQEHAPPAAEDREEPAAVQPEAAPVDDAAPAPLEDEPDAVAPEAEDEAVPATADHEAEPEAVEDESAAVEDDAELEPVEDEPEPELAVAEDAEPAVAEDGAELEAVDDEPESAAVEDAEPAAVEDEADEAPPALAEEPSVDDDREPANADAAPEADEDLVAEEPAAGEPDGDQAAAPAGVQGGPDLRTVAAHLAVSRIAGGADPKSSRLPGGLSIPQKLQPPRIARPRVRPAPARRPAPKPSPLAGGAKRKRKRQPVRITGVTMVVLGLLILAYGTVTLVWQDPWTAWQTARAQKRAKVQYDKIVKDFRKSAAAQTKVATRDWLHRQAALFNLHTPEGSPIGRLSIPKIGIHFTLVQGTEETTLQKGPAHYVETPLPGAKGKWTVGIAGHRTTYLAPFRHIDQLSPGDKVYISMPYARFTYSVEKTRIVDATNQTVLAADSAITDRKPYNRLALTACHPPFSAAQRIIVYARLMYYKVNRGHA